MFEALTSDRQTKLSDKQTENSNHNFQRTSWDLYQI